MQAEVSKGLEIILPHTGAASALDQDDVHTTGRGPIDIDPVFGLHRDKTQAINRESTGPG